jgi:hypothetical protein
METDYNVSAATRVIITGVAMSLLFLAACRWRRRFGLLLGLLALTWAALFPIYWSDWFSTPRALREYGEWRPYIGVGVAMLPLLLVGVGCLRHEKRAA